MRHVDAPGYGPCMCGDPFCPSCGPAQGYPPADDCHWCIKCGGCIEHGECECEEPESYPSRRYMRELTAELRGDAKMDKWRDEQED